MTDETFEAMLSGGHHNSLGRTEDVVDVVLTDKTRLGDLFDTYSSEDAVVRMRVSSAIKRVCKAHPDWIMPYIPRLLTDVAQLQQPSAQWTLAQILRMLADRLSDEQHQQAVNALKHNLTHYTDWIVLIDTMKTLGTWAQQDDDLRAWLAPHIERLSADSRISVAKQARNWQTTLYGDSA